MTLETRRFAPKRKGSSSTYLFSGAFAVGFREGKMKARTQKACLPLFFSRTHFSFLGATVTTLENPTTKKHTIDQPPGN